MKKNEYLGALIMMIIACLFLGGAAMAAMLVGATPIAIIMLTTMGFSTLVTLVSTVMWIFCKDEED